MEVDVGPWGYRPARGEPVLPRAEMPHQDEQVDYACGQCGAISEFKPGSRSLVCPYCGFEDEIVEASGKIVEQDLVATLEKRPEAQDLETTNTVKCGSCAAEFSFDRSLHADDCPFCGTPIVTDTDTNHHIKPQAVLPFAVTEKTAMANIGKWLKGLWFAPSKLTKYARKNGRLSGMYVPYWTYDSNTQTDYTGQRGDTYYVTRSVRVMVNGKPQMQQQRVAKIRWTPVSGRVRRAFDDVLILASRSLPRSITEKLEPWDIENLEPYNKDFLSGFRSESYQIHLADGFGLAKELMDAVIRNDVRYDIGGDHQRIHGLSTSHYSPTFKHILLPAWLSAFRYGGKTYRLVINGRTGEVHGERPYSIIKIILAVLLALVVIGGGVLLLNYLQQAGYFDQVTY